MGDEDEADLDDEFEDESAEQAAIDESQSQERSGEGSYGTSQEQSQSYSRSEGRESALTVSAHRSAEDTYEEESEERSRAQGSRTEEESREKSEDDSHENAEASAETPVANAKAPAPDEEFREKYEDDSYEADEASAETPAAKAPAADEDSGEKYEDDSYEAEEVSAGKPAVATSAADEESGEKYEDDSYEADEASAEKPAAEAPAADEESGEKYEDDSYEAEEASAETPAAKASLSGEISSGKSQDSHEAAKAHGPQRGASTESLSSRRGIAVNFLDDGEAAESANGDRGRRGSAESTPHPGKLKCRFPAHPSDGGEFEEGEDDDEEESEEAVPAEPLLLKIVGAAGLRNADEGSGGNSDPYCICEIEGQPGCRVETGAVEDADDLVWNCRTELHGYFLGDNLLFTVMDRDTGKEDDLLGRAVLKGEVLEAGDFDGELVLTETGVVEGAAVLGIKVQVPPGLPRRRATRRRATNPELTRSDEQPPAEVSSSVRFEAEAADGSHDERLGSRRRSADSTPSAARAAAMGRLPSQDAEGVEEDDVEEDEEEECQPQQEEVAQGDEEEAAGVTPSAASTPASSSAADGAADNRQGRASVRFQPETPDEDAPPRQGERGGRRSSRDSTPRWPKDAWEQAGDHAADEDMGESEHEMVVIEDVLDEPSQDMASNAGQQSEALLHAEASQGSEVLSTAEEEFLLDGRSPQGAPGVALRSSKGGSLSGVSRTASTPSLRKRRRPHRVPANQESAFNRKAQKWDGRFNLVEGENDQKPRNLRNYFSRPASLPDLKRELHQKGQEALARHLASQEEKPIKHSVPNSADSSAPLLPLRHRLGGKMADMDTGNIVPWNNRWNAGMSNHNEGLHPQHRTGFSRKSVFEGADSQRWRRFVHVEVAPSVWRRAQCDSKRFPPLGV